MSTVIKKNISRDFEIRFVKTIRVLNKSKWQREHEPLNLETGESKNRGNILMSRSCVFNHMSVIQGHISVIYPGSYINKASPRIVNIVENRVLRSYNVKRLLKYFASIQSQSNVHVVISNQVYCLSIKANFISLEI